MSRPAVSPQVGTRTLSTAFAVDAHYTARAAYTAWSAWAATDDTAPRRRSIRRYGSVEQWLAANRLANERR